MMNTLFKVLILGFFLMIQTSLCSLEHAKECDILKKAEEGYKKYLENTVWIVPNSTLLAYEYSDGNHVSVADQTVWVINQYDKGYFFGDAYVGLNGRPSSQRKILGSITPHGDVYITFYPLTENTQSTDIVNGIGRFKKRKGKYFFVMQMNSAQNTLTGLCHWSYMISVQPNDYLYHHLPGVGISVPEFINQF